MKTSTKMDADFKGDNKDYLITTLKKISKVQDLYIGKNNPRKIIDSQFKTKVYNKLGNSIIDSSNKFFYISDKIIEAVGNLTSDVVYKFRNINKYEVLGTEENVKNFRQLIKNFTKNSKIIAVPKEGIGYNVLKFRE